MEFQQFISHYKEKLKRLFTEQADINKLSLKRGLPSDILEEILRCRPLAAFIPSEYGGRGVKTHEALAVLEASSYESLPLSLMMGINGALFLQPVTNYGNESVKEEIFGRFLNEQNMGGLMVTEPDYGTDALGMETSFRNDGMNYHISGTKHWQGLTGMANYWLVTARRQNGNGHLDRDISMFIHDTQRGGIQVKEYFNNPGLFMIPYGRNEVDITVPQEYKLEPNTIGIKMLLDILHRSRLQFPGMGIGFLKRLLDEAHQHCKQRSVGGKTLFQYDQVKKRIGKIQSSFTICSAMCAYTSEHVNMEQDVSSSGVIANTIKTVTTDLMHNAAQSVLQLMGAKGYTMDHIAGRAIVDSRPFQIFEGSNDVLYKQISESVIKSMRGAKLTNLYEYMKEYRMTNHSSEYFKDILNFELNTQLAQDKLVELGRAISRIISMQLILNIGQQGFNQKLISSAIDSLRSDVQRFMGTFKKGETPEVVEDYDESSSWLQFFSPVLA